MENFFQYYYDRTGRQKPDAVKIIRIVSGYVAKNYPKQFSVMVQYFLQQIQESRHCNKENGEQPLLR